jgi:hypothetical protein
MKYLIYSGTQAVVLAFILLSPFRGSAQTNAPGHALVFSGTNQDAFVVSQSSLDAYPMTVMAWIKTTTTNLCAVVNKYHALTTTGYQLFLQNGHIEAFYFASSGNTVPVNTSFLDGGAVNDGNWHHVAFAVGPTGAWLCKDGVETASAAWTGTPGPTTDGNDLFFGLYPGLPAQSGTGYYAGEIDEVSLWNVALLPSQIQTYMNRSLSGYEPNLAGYWRFDEGSGSTTADVSGNGNTAYISGATWTASTASVGIVPPTGYSQNWATVNTMSVHDYWNGLAASADLTKLAAVAYSGDIYTSTNFGTNWQITTAPTQLWSGIAGSADGTKLLAAANGNLVYISTNSGVTWRAANVPANNEWQAVACSSDGTRMVATTFSQGGIFISTDSGNTWSNRYSVGYCESIASSANGLKLAAVGTNIFISTNGGTNWNVSGAPALDWYQIACSADGTTLLADQYYSTTDTLLYVSRDSGLTWNPVGQSNAWDAVAMSTDGNKMLASVVNGPIYVSVDSGNTWQPTDTGNDDWNQIATSVDGLRSVALADKVIGSLAPPSAQLSKTGSNGMIVWPSPSTGFLLQQSSSLSTPNWTNVPIRPMVTNSQNQVLLTPTNNFYRLTFP